MLSPSLTLVVVRKTVTDTSFDTNPAQPTETTSNTGIGHSAYLCQFCNYEQRPETPRLRLRIRRSQVRVLPSVNKDLLGTRKSLHILKDIAHSYPLEAHLCCSVVKLGMEPKLGKVCNFALHVGVEEVDLAVYRGELAGRVEAGRGVREPIRAGLALQNRPAEQPHAKFQRQPAQEVCGGAGNGLGVFPVNFLQTVTAPQLRQCHQLCPGKGGLSDQTLRSRQVLRLRRRRGHLDRRCHYLAPVHLCYTPLVAPPQPSTWHNPAALHRPENRTANEAASAPPKRTSCSPSSIRAPRAFFGSGSNGSITRAPRWVFSIFHVPLTKPSTKRTSSRPGWQ